MQTVQDGQHREHRRAFDDFGARRGIAPRVDEPDQERRDCDDAKRVGREPVVPDRQGRGRRGVEEDVTQRTADARDGTRGNRGRSQPEHIAQPVETERRAEIALDQPRNEHRFACVAQAENECAPDVTVAQDIGHDGRDYRPRDDRHPCYWSNADQRAHRDARGRPENRDTVGLGEQGKAEPRGKEVSDAHRDR